MSEHTFFSCGGAAGTVELYPPSIYTSILYVSYTDKVYCFACSCFLRLLSPAHKTIADTNALNVAVLSATDEILPRELWDKIRAELLPHHRLYIRCIYLQLY